MATLLSITLHLLSVQIYGDRVVELADNAYSDALLADLQKSACAISRLVSVCVPLMCMVRIYNIFSTPPSCAIN